MAYHDEADRRIAAENERVRAKKFDAAVLAIVPIVLGLTERGRAKLAREGTHYLSDAEAEKMKEIVTAVENALK